MGSNPAHISNFFKISFCQIRLIRQELWKNSIENENKSILASYHDEKQLNPYQMTIYVNFSQYISDLWKY